jgi:GTP cyclohydrolase III
MFFPDKANQSGIRNVLSSKLKTRQRNKITSVRITSTNSFGTTHIFIYIFHMTITINSPFYQRTPYIYTNQINSFELVHTLDKFLEHVSALTYHLGGEKLASFLKAKLVYDCRNMWEKLSNVCVIINLFVGTIKTCKPTQDTRSMKLKNSCFYHLFHLRIGNSNGKMFCSV